MSDWALIPNPAYAGQTPRIVEAVCHDRSPFVTVRCSCGSDMHLHESQTDGIPPDAELATTCRTCAQTLVFPPGYFRAAFQRLRAEGWIA
jgi:hypothetical protein